MRIPTVVILSVALSCGAMSGCSDKKKARLKAARARQVKKVPKPERPAPGVEWRGRGRAEMLFVGEGPRKYGFQKAKLSVFCCLRKKKAGFARVSASHMPRGTKIELPGMGLKQKKKGRGSRTYMYFEDLDLRDRLADVPLDVLRRPMRGKRKTLYHMPKMDLKIPVTIKIPWFHDVKTRLPELNVGRPVQELFRGVSRGPVTFGADDRAAGKPTSAVMVWRSHMTVISPKGKKVRDVDWVAFSETMASGNKKRCGGYNIGSITFKLLDTVVTVHDRRTGMPLGNKSFPPNTRCPRFHTRLRGKASVMSASRGKVEAWVARMLKRGSFE